MPCDFIALFWVFSYIFNDHSWKYCIFTKLSQIVFKFWYVNMPNVTTSYGRLSDLIAFFWEFIFYKSQKVQITNKCLKMKWIKKFKALNYLINTLNKWMQLIIYSLYFFKKESKLCITSESHRTKFWWYIKFMFKYVVLSPKKTQSQKERIFPIFILCNFLFYAIMIIWVVNTL